MAIIPKHTAAALNIFTTMSSLARKENAYNLSQGLPDFPVFPALSDLLKEATIAGFNQYAPMPGLLELRENIATVFNNRYRTDFCTPDTVTVTPGATYGIFTALATVLNKGDEVIYLEPAFDCYVPAIEINGGIPVCIRLEEENHFEIAWQQISDAITARTRAIIINTPHNPTGRVWTQSDWDQLASIIGNREIYVISDEVYDTIVYDGQQHLPGFLQKGLEGKVLSVYSFGKMYHITGWKVGFLIAAPALTEAFRSIHQYLSFSVNTPAQYALAKYLLLPHQEPASVMLQAKRDLLLTRMQPSRFRLNALSKGTYFQLFDYSAISDMDDVTFARWLATAHKVATIPLSAFYRKPPGIKQVRLSFAKNDDILNAATEILCKL
ncbi:aminotransferase class I/II-fold pyridoxal phosphate-dependent enzyme [Niabella pedocola]|uniref:Aminotransferase class I/II-fold pyridoxal phosphate-dependent enzyme n=1 Tax=Niabella pedocola TaxID=1752077 RepID=A0ABS8PXD2_9BACT|nr:methionine aminotransferase [Niabella pedocola]MCD2425711.1 aminotransferase class I/II-fold pyridoxal phosphate-dependent enzyme [Niabella pedocola]